MRRLLSCLGVIGLSLVSCSGLSTPVPTSTSTATSILPSPTVTSSPTPGPVTLLAEKDLETQTGTSYSLDWSLDGEMLAVASGVEITLLSSDLKDTIVVLKPASGALTAVQNPEGTNFATVVGARNPKITLWNWDVVGLQLTQDQQISAGYDQYGVSWSPDGKLLATLANDRKSVIQIWDTATWKLLNKYDLPYTIPRRALIWSSDSTTVYDSGDLDGQAVFFGLNVQDGSVQELGKLPTAQVYAFTISSDEKWIAVADESGKTQIIEVESGKLLTEFQSVSEPVDLGWNPAMMTLAILGYKTELQLWRVMP